MKKGKKRYTKKDIRKAAGTALLLVLLVIILTYIIFNTAWLRPKLNELSASYISLNNTNTTDMLKVTNLRRLSNEKGKSFRNKAYKEFQITGQQNSSYQIVLYHIGEKIDEAYVHYYLENEHQVIKDGIIKVDDATNDGGRVIYTGNIKDGKNWKLKMWIDKDYKGEVSNISYEIRIKNK